MPAADKFRAIAHRVRAIPGRFGLRPFRAYIVTSTYSGTYAGDGTETETVTELLESGQPPKVEFAGEEQIATGSMERGEVTVGPITPQHATGGTALSTIDVAAVDQQNVWLKLVGPGAVDRRFAVLEVSTDKSLRYMIRARAVGET